MQMTVHVCYDREVTGVLNQNVFQAPFFLLQIVNRKPLS